MGVDGCLQENLLSHFTLDYPNFELLFCVQNENDPVIKLLQSLCEEYPNVNTRLFIGGKDGVINPLVHNMVPAYEAAKYDLIWVSTSRVKASTKVIWDFAHKARDPSVAIVHQLPFFADHPGFVSVIEKVTFGCYLARSCIALNQLGVTCFTGMSYIVKKSILNETGGLAYFGKYLAEDYFLGTALYEKGYRIVMSSYPVIQNVSNGTLISYIKRMVRWLRLRLNMVPLVSGILEPISESITLGFLFAITMHYLFDIKLMYPIIIHFILWILLDYILLRCLQNSQLPFSFATFLLAWISRELLVYVVFITALSNPWRIKWGDYYYRIYFGGLTKRLSSNNNKTFVSHSNNGNFLKANINVTSNNHKFSTCGTSVNLKKLSKKSILSENIHLHDIQRSFNKFHYLNNETVNNSHYFPHETHLLSCTMLELSPLIHNNNNNDHEDISTFVNIDNSNDHVNSNNPFSSISNIKTNTKISRSSNKTFPGCAHANICTKSLSNNDNYSNGIDSDKKTVY
ncbi:Ceramide glucosyltransferase isoform 1 [Schistosoma japonicum]|nr:Ceramide glucosyltransferase isoform 1 [Schistosoma japonicum]